jgi:hypothetical protein
VPRTQVWRVHLNNALNALAEDFTEVVNMPESRWVAGYRAILKSYDFVAIARARTRNIIPTIDRVKWRFICPRLAVGYIRLAARNGNAAVGAIQIGKLPGVGNLETWRPDPGPSL